MLFSISVKYVDMPGVSIVTRLPVTRSKTRVSRRAAGAQRVKLNLGKRLTAQPAITDNHQTDRRAAPTPGQHLAGHQEVQRPETALAGDGSGRTVTDARQW